MGAVPEEKAGVASAMSDVARQVGGALGVAVIGSLVGSLYSSRVEDATGALPAEQATAASDSVGAAVAIADGLPGSAGAALEHAAANAYTEALGLGLLAAAAVALTGAASSRASCLRTTGRWSRRGRRRWPPLRRARPRGRLTARALL